jgi:hypothetical protein
MRVVTIVACLLLEVSGICINLPTSGSVEVLSHVRK